MRKLITLFLILIMAFTAFGSKSAFDIEWWSSATYSSLPSNTLRQCLEGMEGRIGGVGTGETFYVDTDVTNEGDGSSWDNAKDTLQEAIDLCVADRGDVIRLAEGTAESVISSGLITVDCAGISIISEGNGNLRATFTASTDAAAKILVTAANVYFENVIFQSGKADLATVILNTAAGTVFNKCTFRDSTSGLGMVTVGAADGDSDGFTLVNCDFYQPGTTNDHSVEILFDMNSVRIVNNTFHGDYDEGVIYIPAGGNACLDVVIVGNVITQLQASIFAINIHGTSTSGIIAGNYVNATDNYECDPGACDELVNSWQQDIDITTNNLDHLMKTVVADDTGPIDLTEIVDKTALSWILSSDGDTATFVPSTMALSAISTSVEAILVDTDATLDGVLADANANVTLILEDTGTTLPAAIATVDGVADNILIDTAAMQPLTEQSAMTTLTTIMSGQNGLFTVAGGPVKIIEIIGYVATEIEGKSCLINYTANPTDPATDTQIATTGTALEINADAIGTLYTWDGVLANNLTATDNGVALGTAAYSGVIIPAGAIELKAVVSTSATGAIEFYVRYIPLVSGATVTAQ